MRFPIRDLEKENKWHEWFIGLAQYIATASKDPSTKVGSVVVRPDKTIASIGYNGFPRGIKDDERLLNRDLKYQLIVHAETNVILNARESLVGYTLYSTMLPCDRCATSVIQAGIREIHTVPLPFDKMRWIESMERSESLFKEARIKVVYHEIL